MIVLLGLWACGGPPEVSMQEPGPPVAEPLRPAVEARAATREAFARAAHRREQRFLRAVGASRVRLDDQQIRSGPQDAARLFEAGGGLFQHTFSRAEGFGRGSPTLTRVHEGSLGGPDAFRCASCHWRGGPAGAGDGADVTFLEGDGQTTSSALVRDPPALVGAGWVERLSIEMSAALQEQREAGLSDARRSGEPVQVSLGTAGVSFGVVVAHPDGRVDTAALEGIDDDLVIKPFGRTGRVASLREIVEQQLWIHHGMQTHHGVQQGIYSVPDEGKPDDPDGDGVTEEITEGELTSLTAYLALQETPTEELPRRADYVLAAARGRRDFEALGCASCHVPSLPLEDATWTLSSRLGGDDLVFDLEAQAARPVPVRDAQGVLQVRLYSDLKRHDMGEALADSRERDGIEATHFITPPLWGLSRSGPWLHDGRAGSVEAAILLHGGEASAARDAYAALSEKQRAPLRMFLTTLTRARRFDVP